MGRRKDANWEIPENSVTTEQAQLGVLMDIRDELKRLNENLRYAYELNDMARQLGQINRRLAKRIKL